MKTLFNKLRLFVVSIWLLFANVLPKKEDKTLSLYPLNLQFFADGGDGGGDGGDGGSGGDSGAGSGTEKTFTQEDVNKMIKDRLPRAEKKAQEALAKSLGFESVEAMQAAINPNKDKDKDKDTVDVDKVVEAKLKEERDKTFKRLVNSEVKLVANELGFADWEDALALADLSDVKEDEKGNIVGVKEALEALKTKKPHLLKATNRNFGVDVNNTQQRTKESLDNIKKLASTRGAQQTTAYNPWA
jgi:hypothetical protein